jgi:nicotinate dehydrogenase subunit B
MTGFLHEQEFSRTSFLKGGGALIVGFSLAGAVGTKAAHAAFNPDSTLVDSWLSVNADNTVTFKTSQIEVGNGVTTGLLMIVAEEMNLSYDQVHHSFWDSTILVNSGSTGGSTGIQRTAGPPLRAAAAYAYQTLLGLASTSLGVPVASLSVDQGVVSGGGKTVTYGELTGGKLLNAKMLTPTLDPGVAPAKPVSDYKIVTTRPPRIDIPAKVAATYTYVHNVRIPGMLHGRVVRPRGQGAYGTGAPIISVDESSIKNIPDAQVVRKGDFLGVVAPHEYDAIQAAAQLKVTWKENPILPGSGNLWKQMRDQDSAGMVPAAITQNDGNVDTALASAAKVVSQTYMYHYQGRAVIGPGCSVASVTPTSATVFTSSQQMENVHTDIANLLGMDVSQVRVIWYEGASSFGGGGTFPVLPHESAAIMSQAVGKPVRVQYMRWDEMGWDQFGPAQLMDMRGGIDAGGKIVAYDFTMLGQPGTSLDLTRELMGTPYPKPGTLKPNTPNTAQGYDISNKRLTGKTTPLFNGYFKNGSLRDPQGPQTSFASEQLIDELAFAAGMDPIEFRRQNITDDRWLAPMNAAVAAANWQPRVANSVKQTGDVVTGRGFGFGRHGTAAYAASVAEIEVNMKTGKITATHIYGAIDAGLAVNPALVENQISGNLVMGLSRALNEEVAFTKGHVTGLDWVSYPILRFKDHPKVTTVVVQRTDKLPLGAGEPPQTTVAPAVANAFFDATGVRIREAPMTPARVRATLKAAGVA